MSVSAVLMLPNQPGSPACCPPLWIQLSCHSALPAGEDGEMRDNKVRSMATQLLAKFEENSSAVQNRSKVRRYEILKNHESDPRIKP